VDHGDGALLLCKKQAKQVKPSCACPSATGFDFFDASNAALDASVLPVAGRGARVRRGRRARRPRRR
jgi:hypothetical protein